MTLEEMIVDRRHTIGRLTADLELLLEAKRILLLGSSGRRVPDIGVPLPPSGRE